MLEQNRNIVDYVLADAEDGLTLVLDETSDTAADCSPLNVIIITSKRVLCVDTFFLKDNEGTATGLSDRVIDWWTQFFESRTIGSSTIPEAVRGRDRDLRTGRDVIGPPRNPTGPH